MYTYRKRYDMEYKYNVDIYNIYYKYNIHMYLEKCMCKISSLLKRIVICQVILPDRVHSGRLRVIEPVYKLVHEMSQTVRRRRDMAPNNNLENRPCQ